MCVRSVAVHPAARFGLDGKMPKGDDKAKELAMLLCSSNCKKALKSKDCKDAGWTKDMTQKVLGNCKSLDDAKEKAQKKAQADPRHQEYTEKSEEAERKRKYAEGCRDMLAYECGVGHGDHTRALKLMCTPGQGTTTNKRAPDTRTITRTTCSARLTTARASQNRFTTVWEKASFFFFVRVCVRVFSKQRPALTCSPLSRTPAYVQSVRAR